MPDSPGSSCAASTTERHPARTTDAPRPTNRPRGIRVFR
jgi:hypothetical protein